MDTRPIGVFDSGLGGLTAVRQLRQLLADPAAILAMAQHNADYYQMWLRPEQQVRQALRQLETGEL